MNPRTPYFCCVLLAGSMFWAPGLRAQHGGGGGGGGFPHGGGMPGGGFPGGGFPGGGGSRGEGGSSPGDSRDNTGSASPMRGGLQLGPPGRWWDDKHFVKDLKLRPDQQRRMDATFEENRPNLLRRLEGLQQEEVRMEALERAKTLDETALNGQIERVAQARADLEKANTHYLLQIRAEMEPDQIARLEQRR